jgi:hypothetical protein
MVDAALDAVPDDQLIQLVNELGRPRGAEEEAGSLGLPELRWRLGAGGRWLGHPGSFRETSGREAPSRDAGRRRAMHRVS